MILFGGYTSGDMSKGMHVHLVDKCKVIEYIEHVIWAQHAKTQNMGIECSYP